MKKVGKIIKDIRLKMGISPPELSRELGLKSTSHVWMIENGIKNPSVSLCNRLIKVASEYGIDVTLDDLLGE